MAKNNTFYLGKIYDLKKKSLLDEKLEYDPPDLTTHAIITGMTGSGKTGLCIGLLEEAALQNIPAIIIDPKGDLTNLVLTFPKLQPDDFAPWIDASSAKRAGKSIADVAAETANAWKKGLNDWGFGESELSNLKKAVKRTIYTPGSTTGMPVNIMASFEAPGISWKENEEVLRDKISSTVTALLTLIGMKEIDPLRSREHILIANIIEEHWKNEKSLDLLEIIHQIQTPPFDQLGAFSLNDFFPKKDRSELALLLNNFLASPSFQSWIEGPRLDIQKMLYESDGTPKHTIFYLAHLDEAERMFFVTLIYAAIETWMRQQKGTGDLRALVYFDEIHGYLPPVSNPPSKPLLIRLLKTARAFGVGFVLTTQNPVDIDYKAISNAGTWMIGRLQTDQDKQRLLDGLESAAGGIKRAEFDKLISGLGKRVFLYHNVHEKKPAVFHTRWVMNYLAGPQTISQIDGLNQLAGATPFQEKGSDKKPSTASKTKDSQSPQNLPKTISHFFIAAGKGSQYEPKLLAVAEVRYLRQRPPVNFTHTIAAIVSEPRETGQAWEKSLAEEFTPSKFSAETQVKKKYANVPDFFEKESWWSSQEKEFEHWIYETDTISIQSCKKLDLTAGAEITEVVFKNMCEEAAKKKIKADIDSLENKFTSKKTYLENKIEKQQLRVDK